MRAFFQPLGPLLRAWAWSALVCGVLAFALVGQFVWSGAMPANEGWRIVAREWAPWAVISPLLIRLVSRVPLGRARWQVASAVHLISMIVVVGLYTWWAEALFPPPGMALAGHGPPPPHRWVFGVLFFRLPIYLTVVSVAHSVYFRGRALERDSSLASARLEALKMQLQPHFLFNALNAIAELVHLDPNVADEMLVALSRLLRLSLDTSAEQLLPLRRELELVKSYLAIEHVRFGDRLRFEVDAPPEVQEALTPAFLLQPLVENAVHHGLEPRAGAGVLKIRAVRIGASLRLTVSDNGVGVVAGAPLREGIGIANTRARLHVLFDDAASLFLRSEGGFTAEVTIPFRTAP